MRFWYFELVFFGLFLFLIIFSSSPNPQLDNPEYVPDAVTGIATIGGTITAFTGYLLSHLLKRIKDTPKKWIGKRVVVIVILLGFGLIFLMFGFQELVYGSLQGAYNGATFGVVLILLAFFEVMFMIFVSEIEQLTDISGEL
jgi:hypothetical protein